MTSTAEQIAENIRYFNDMSILGQIVFYVLCMIAILLLGLLWASTDKEFGWWRVRRELRRKKRAPGGGHDRP